VATKINGARRSIPYVVNHRALSKKGESRPRNICGAVGIFNYSLVWYKLDLSNLIETTSAAQSVFIWCFLLIAAQSVSLIIPWDDRTFIISFLLG
jgi:hypothetical protein